METKPLETLLCSQMPSQGLLSSRRQCKDLRDLATYIYLTYTLPVTCQNRGLQALAFFFRLVLYFTN